MVLLWRNDAAERWVVITFTTEQELTLVDDCCLVQVWSWGTVQTVLAHRPHGSWKCSAWKRTFLKMGLRVQKSQNAALPFPCGQQIRILSETMTPSPHPSTSSLGPLNPTTSHNNNNNNNGGLHAHVRAAEDIEPVLELTRLVVECEPQQQFGLINGPHKRFWLPCTSHFRLLLGVFSFSVDCLFVYGAQA